MISELAQAAGSQERKWHCVSVLWCHKMETFNKGDWQRLMFCNCEQEEEAEDLGTVYFLKTTSKLFRKAYVWICIKIHFSV